MLSIEFRNACACGVNIRPYIEKYPSFVNCVGPSGWTPLFYAVRSNQIEVVKVLLEHGANPLVRDTKGITLMDIAIKKEYIEMITLLKSFI